MLDLVRTVWKQRRLLRHFVVRDLKGRYVGSSMGFFWSVIYPIVNLFVFMFVFHLILKARWSDRATPQETALLMLTGILVWVAFSETLSRSTNCLVDNANLIKKVVFPSEILPPYLAVSSLVNMVIGLPIVLAGRAVFVESSRLPGIELVCVPLLIVVQTIFTVGLGYVLSTLNVYLRDTFHLIGVVTMVWMFATPIFYPAELVAHGRYLLTSDPDGPMIEFRWLLELNPMHWLIDSWRAVMLEGTWPEWGLLLRFAVVAVIVFALGAKFFASQKKRFPDVI